MTKSFRLRNILIIFIFFLFVCNGLATIFAEKTSMEKDGTPRDYIPIKGVVDRIEDGELAVILVEELGLEFVVSTNNYNVELSQNVWVDLVLDGGEIRELTIDWEKTKEEEKEVKELMKELKKDND